VGFIVRMQAGRVAAPRPASARTATAHAGICGGPRSAACFLRALRQPASVRQAPAAQPQSSPRQPSSRRPVREGHEHHGSICLLGGATPPQRILWPRARSIPVPSPHPSQAFGIQPKRRWACSTTRQPSGSPQKNQAAAVAGVPPRHGIAYSLKRMQYFGHYDINDGLVLLLPATVQSNPQGRRR
jgi:hypothetical protein